MIERKLYLCSYEYIQFFVNIWQWMLIPLKIILAIGLYWGRKIMLILRCLTLSPNSIFQTDKNYINSYNFRTWNVMSYWARYSHNNIFWVEGIVEFLFFAYSHNMAISVVPPKRFILVISSGLLIKRNRCKNIFVNLYLFFQECF